MPERANMCYTARKLLILPLLALLMAPAVARAQDGPPNVILFFVDDMGWADWGRSAQNPNGSDLYQTPNMQRLADQGVVFDNGYASAPVCSPTRVSLMTGREPAAHTTTDFIGAGDGALRSIGPPVGWSQNLAPTEITLAEAFQAANYTTGFFGKWHLGQAGTNSANPLLNGFDVNVGGTNSGNPGFAGGFFAGADGAWAGMPGLDTPGAFAPTDYLSDALSAEAAGFISANAAAGDPFFLTMSHYVVHTPIEAPASLVQFYQQRIADLESQGVDLGGQDNATYAAMVDLMDQSLGNLLDTLEDPDGNPNTADSILDNTIVVFTADNGGLVNFGVTSNRPLSEGKGSVYEGGIREPYIVSWTGNAAVQQGAVNSTPVVTHDIYPTLLELTGVAGSPTHNATVDGVSFAAALGGAELDREPIVWHYPHQSPQDAGDNGAVVDGGQFVSAVRDGDWKLIWFYEQGTYELYNLANDLGEQQNVLTQNPAVALQLSATLQRSLQAAGAQTPTLRRGPAPRPLELPPLAVLTRPIAFDDFAADHDFKADGVAGTQWDGVENAGSAQVLASSGGRLTLQNAAGVNTNINAGSFNAPFLYEEWTGDFEAQLEIASMTSIDFHVLAIAAVDPGGELLWIGQQDRGGDGDFAQARSFEGASRNEQNYGGTYRFLRLVREGDEFRGYASQDGLFWRQFAGYDRADLPETLRVGITQGSFGAGPVIAEIESFVLRPFIALPGDFNDDGIVDGADYAVWRGGLGTAYTQADLEVWRINFGATRLPAAAAASTGTPEPATAAIALIAAGLIAVRRRRP
ncbi:MAG: sulfatase [Planctomycetota bacterium]